MMNSRSVILLLVCAVISSAYGQYPNGIVFNDGIPPQPPAACRYVVIGACPAGQIVNVGSFFAIPAGYCYCCAPPAPPPPPPTTTAAPIICAVYFACGRK